MTNFQIAFIGYAAFACLFALALTIGYVARRCGVMSQTSALEAGLVLTGWLLLSAVFAYFLGLCVLIGAS